MAQFRISAFADEAAADFIEQIQALRANDIGQIEVRGVNGKNISALTDGEAREAAAKLGDYGIGISSMGSPYGKYPINEPIGKHIEDFKRGLDICAIMGIERIRMFSFFMPSEQEADIHKNAVYDGIDAMLNLAKPYAIRLSHENEKGIYGDVTHRCVELMRAFDGRMGFIFDPANFIQCGVEPLEAFGELSRYTDYMHIKDALLDGGAVVPAGAGDGDVAAILSRLADERTDEVTLTVEPHLTVFKGLEGLQDDALAHKYHYPDAGTAFAAAVGALKDILASLNFKQNAGGKLWTR